MPAILRRVGVCLPSWLSAISVSALAAVLAAVGRLPWADAAWVVSSTLVAFLPTAWQAPLGWKRRAAETALLPVAAALSLVPDLTMLRMLLPPLLVVAASAAVLAALPRTPEGRRPLLWAAYGLAVRAAGGLGLAGAGPLAIAVAVAASAILPWAAAAWGPGPGSRPGSWWRLCPSSTGRWRPSRWSWGRSGRSRGAAHRAGA